ncbi:Isoquinoline 1-oxidoreductase alpha subunit [hydrothermal vent metagenome]|uniref:Isoquinoline 1-oxidoreductase alpha subunit n=1 Tax=hydrothermal vent metagenome TaxID=652676 RepID=A0A3B0RVG7_9ZZZZ
MQITINGKQITVPENRQDVTLLGFLRDSVGLKGAKFGCGAGLCGACTVHVDGLAKRSCQLTTADVVGSKIVTIEGLAQTTGDANLHPVQKAWIEVGVPQCGYCQAGQIMSASALLARNPDPSETEIRTEMSGNLCRCGTYERIRQAINLAARESGQ